MKRQMRILFAACLAGCATQLLGKLSFSKPSLETTFGNSTFRLENKLRLDGSFAKNAKLLNDENGGLDKTAIPGRFILDSAFHHFLRNPECQWDTAHTKVGIRCKGTFGAPESTLKTAPVAVKDLDAVAGSHFHPLPIHIPIVREIWGEYMLNDLLGLSFENQHTFTMGLFPFSLGRGIALGDAYAVAPDFIGYDPYTAVDQYAPGMRISGELLCNHILDYDLYAGITDNFADSFNAVNLKTQGQFFGHRFNQARGFGVINYIIAGRLKWTPFAEVDRKLYLEPYVLFNDERTQKVEIAGDASSKLGTFGLSCEVMRDGFEVGFDVAHNIGRQHVKGLDRNAIIKELRITNSFDAAGNLVTGNIAVPAFVNSHVVTIPPTPTAASVKVGYNVSKPLQAEIDSAMGSTTPCSDLEYLNGKEYTNQLPNQGGAPISVRNANDRFRDPYVNEFCGTMLVADAAYKVRPNFKIAGTIGYSTGDENPNKDLDELNESSVDGTYCGFIGLQEAYAGKRVRSPFLMGGSGKIPRILSYPVNKDLNLNTNLPSNEFPTQLSRFTNLAFLGAALWWEVEDCVRRWEINPNILTFWQPYAPRVFNKEAGVTTSSFAHKHIGTELNLFVDVTMAPGLKAFVVAGVFVSGQYYDDLEGHPLSKGEKAYLDSLDGVGGPVDVAPVLGNDNAFFFNGGIEYRF